MASAASEYRAPKSAATVLPPGCATSSLTAVSTTGAVLVATGASLTAPTVTSNTRVVTSRLEVASS